MAPAEPRRRARRLPAGTPVALENLDGAPMQRVLLGATWDAPDFDVDMCAVLLDGSDRVPDSSWFLYRRNRQAPGHVGFVGYVRPGEESGPDRAQILLDLERMPQEIVQVIVGFSAAQPRTLLPGAGVVKTRAMDLDTAQTSYVYVHDTAGMGSVPALATCLTLWQLRRTPTGWATAVVGAPYRGGPPAFARDHGVTFG
ncbi:TerD family protein [uncultured Tessaracoccus sp.]|uniref:TerD family protein n=1 Tax=uncultured Tessaracoccus sp. TaxID=905023 RepID=UPI0025FF082E|nr:TerD family protein [uncultured Tessaracoccus sp.]